MLKKIIKLEHTLNPSPLEYWYGALTTELSHQPEAGQVVSS